MISVIIPTYNRATFLMEAIRSVLDQDPDFEKGPGKDLELIIVDDGSTDNTEQKVAGLSAPVVYFRQSHQGVSAARNKGLDLAAGEHIAFLDSDDLWKKEKLRVQMSLMKALPQTRVCYTEEMWIRKGVFVNPKKRHRKHSGWVFDKVLPLCLLSLSSALFHREVFDEIGRFDESLPVCEDYDLGIRLARRYPFRFIDRPLIIKRGGHSDQLSKRYWGMDRYRIAALEKALSLDLTADQERLVKAEIVKKSRILAGGFHKRGKKTEAEKYTRLISRHS